MLRNDYVVTLGDAVECLNSLSSNIKQDYKNNGINIAFGYDEDSNSSSTVCNTVLPVKYVSMNVGVKYMIDNVKDGYDSMHSEDDMSL